MSVAPALSWVEEVPAMGVVDDLARARETFERGDWAAAYDVWSDTPPATPQDLHRMATSALLRGRHAEAVAVLQSAFHDYVAADDPAGACRCAFHLGMMFSTSGEHALGSGWAARAERLLGEVGEGSVEEGYVSQLLMIRALSEGRHPEAQAHAARVLEVGREHGEPDLIAMGLATVGRLGLYTGQVAEGLSLFDEAMATVAAGEVSPVFAGHVYCVMIEGCQDVSDLGRASAWTTALSTWCESQPELVAFTGQCAVHRGQIMRLHGAFREAVEEFDAAVARYLRGPGAAAAGVALAERGDVQRLLGDLHAAELSYEEAAGHGFEPQPGLALLWLARGRTGAALAAIRRLLAEKQDAVGRSKLLAAASEVLLAAGHPGEAREAAGELESIARSFGAEPLLAGAAYAAARVELAGADPAGALPYLRTALALWSGLDATFEVARVRVEIGRALHALGDDDSAAAELAAAARVFTAIGARPALADAESVLAPAARPGGLTCREVEVLQLVATGRSNPQIAAELVLSEKTVARHLSNIFGKIGVATRTAAAAYAFENGLV